MQSIIKYALALFLIPLIFCGTAAARGNSLYQKKLIKNRAEKYESTGGVSTASRDLYIYADDKDIENSIDEIKKTPKALRGETVNIVSPHIGKNAKVRNVNIAVDSKKGIKIDKDRLGLKDNTEINIASPTIQKGAKVRDINITVDARRRGIEIK